MNFNCAEQHPVLELVVELEGESHQRVRQRPSMACNDRALRA